MNVFKFIAAIISLGQVLSAIPVINVHAEDIFTDYNDFPSIHDQVLSEGIQFLRFKQDPTRIWDTPDSNETSFIINIAEYLYDYSEDLDSRSYYQLNEMIMDVCDYYLDMKPINNDIISRIILINDLRMEDICEINNLLRYQNPDGGFGLTEGYTSDIIDTKLALKALTDIGETEAMTNAALYISSLQNEDGGFGYQQGLSSNTYLSADIANILVDTIDVNPVLSYYLEDTFIALDSYLDTTFSALNDLSANDLDTVYQHFYTALYRLKRDGRYDVSPYYALQAEDGGVFDHPMATALYLELLVREQNALVANIDNIAITNDKGYAVSAFNSNENVNISVISEFETDKAHFEMSIIKPDGTSIPLDGDTAVWNTADNPDGEYTVRAEIIRNSPE
jgi:Fe-S-cluster formation regulator IscX/YfhJ